MVGELDEQGHYYTAGVVVVVVVVVCAPDTAFAH